MSLRDLSGTETLDLHRLFVVRSKLNSQMITDHSEPVDVQSMLGNAFILGESLCGSFLPL